MLQDLLSRWPVIQQIRTGSDGTGPEAMTERTRQLRPRNFDAQVSRSVCPYCGVGCELEVHVQDNTIVKIASPADQFITHGHLCVKGRFGFQFVQQRRKRRDDAAGP